MDNNKNNNTDRPFGTFDWSNLSTGQVNKPKDITADMWTPISAGKSFDSASSSRLNDREKAVKKGAEQVSRTKNRTGEKNVPSAKKKKSPPASKNTSAQTKKKSSSSAGSKRPPQKKRSDDGRKISSSAQSARAQYEVQKEQKRLENDRRRYEKSSREYNRQRSAGKAGEEIAKKRARKKRRSKRFYALVVTGVTLFAAVCAVLIFCFAVGSPIAQINVEGESVYSSKEIANACGVIAGDNIFTVSKKRVNEAVCTALPYIGSVEVSRSFPDKLNLTVTATADKYLIKSKSGAYICLDENGKVLSVKKKKVKSGSFRLDGFKGQTVKPGTLYEPCKEDAQRFETAKRIVAALGSNSLSKANVIDLSDLNALVAVYDSRYNIFIGSADELEKKLALAASTLEKSATEKGTGYVDVRFNSMAAFAEGNMNPQ